MKNEQDLFYLCIGVLTLILGLLFYEPKIVREVKSGDKVLTCNIENEWKNIPKEKIIGLDDNGYWVFTNGYARNCEIK